MKTLYIHIGTPKTGSSTLQHFFENNEEALLRNGIYYPKGIPYDRWGGQESTAGNFAWVTRLNLGMDQIVRTVREWFEVSDKVLLSTEHIWLEIGDKASFLAGIRSSADDLEVKVIVYLRKQIDYLESQYREWVRLVLLEESIQEVCDFNNTVLKVVKDSLDYYAVLEKTAQAVGRENMIVRPYEKGQFQNQNIVDDFMRILGVHTDSSFVLPEKNLNPPISNPALELKRQMNASAKAEQKIMNDCFYDILMQDGTERAEKGECAHFKSLLTYQQRQEFMQRFEEGNRKIARYYLNREEGKLFFEEDNVNMQANAVSGEELLKQTIRVFTSAFLENYEKQTFVESRQRALDEKVENFIIQMDKMAKNQQNQIERMMKKQEETCREQIEDIRWQMQECTKQWTGMQKELKEIKNSSSWRMTAPLRKMAVFFRKLKYKGR